MFLTFGELQNQPKPTRSALKLAICNWETTKWETKRKGEEEARIKLLETQAKEREKKAKEREKEKARKQKEKEQKAREKEKEKQKKLKAKEKEKAEAEKAENTKNKYDFCHRCCFALLVLTLLQANLVFFCQKDQ